MASSVALTTVKTGPAVSLTTTLNNIRRFDLNLATKSTLEITKEDNTILILDIQATTVITCTISGGNATLAVTN